MKWHRIYLPLLCFLFLGCNKSEEVWVELFNGKDLQGWHAYGTTDAPDGWFVENGVLTYDFKRRKGESNANLVTDGQYSNFELSIEWKISDKGNSGLFWAVVENEQYEQPYHTGPEIQILDDNWKEYVEGRGDKNRAGALYALMAPSRIVSNGAGVWNHYLLHIDHNENKGYLVFNDTEVLSFPVHGPKWEAMVAKTNFAEFPGFAKARTGHISLQEYGGQVAFRNIKIKVLP